MIFHFINYLFDTIEPLSFLRLFQLQALELLYSWGNGLSGYCTLTILEIPHDLILFHPLPLRLAHRSWEEF